MSNSYRHTFDGMSIKSNPSGPPPSYSRHQNDELLYSNAPAPSFHTLIRRTSRRLSGPRTTTHPSVSNLLNILTSEEPLDLTIDHGLIYPPPPSNALYHLPRVLTWSGNEIFLFRSLPALTSRRPTQTRDLALYTMKRTPFTHEISLMPRREGVRAATMRGKRGLLGGMSWEVDVKGKVALKYAKGKWRDVEGKIVAEERRSCAFVATERGAEDDDDEDSVPLAREELGISAGVEIALKDLVVAAWCTRIWQTNGKVSLARTLVRGEAYVNRDFPNGRSFTQRLAGA